MSKKPGVSIPSFFELTIFSLETLERANIVSIDHMMDPTTPSTPAQPYNQLASYKCWKEPKAISIPQPYIGIFI